MLTSMFCLPECRYSDLNGSAVRQLYARGLVWLEVPVRPEDHLSIPPLEVGTALSAVLHWQMCLSCSWDVEGAAAGPCYSICS